MKLKDNMKNSSLIITGTIIPEKMEMITGILQNNFKIFKEFQNIILMLNTIDKNGEEYLNNYRDLLNNLFSSKTIFHLRDFMNCGWQFGTIIMERTAYDFIKENLPVGMVLKVDFDIYLEEQILELDISNTDAMIMPSIGYATTHDEYKGDFDKMMELYNKIPPQSTIYLILHTMDYLYVDSDWLNKKYKEWIRNPISPGPPAIKVACEPLLRDSFERNNFRIKQMLSKKTFRNLLETIEMKHIVDPSHKNIYFEEVGICHLNDNKIEVIKI